MNNMQRPRRPQKPNILIRIYDTIRTNILLRNTVIAISLGLVLIFVINFTLGIYTRHGQRFVVPNFIGSTLDQAKQSASQGELRLEIVDSLYMPKQPSGMILDQSPKAGMGVKSGRRVFLTINAFRPKMEIIPYVAGYSLRQAKNVLESRGFEIDRLIYRADMATNNIIEESYKGQPIHSGSTLQAELGSAITLTVGVNSESRLPQVPKVIGLTLREAKSRLWELGLNLGNIKNDSNITAEDIEDARIYRQEPNQQSRHEYGGKVSLWLTTEHTKVAEASTKSDAEARKLPPDSPEDSLMMVEDDGITTE